MFRQSAMDSFHPQRGLRWGIVTSSQPHVSYYWLGQTLLTNQGWSMWPSIVLAEEISRVLRALGQSARKPSMAKVPRKPPEPSADATPSALEAKMKKQQHKTAHHPKHSSTQESQCRCYCHQILKGRGPKLIRSFLKLFPPPGLSLAP